MLLKITHDNIKIFAYYYGEKDYDVVLPNGARCDACKNILTVYKIIKAYRERVCYL